MDMQQETIITSIAREILTNLDVEEKVIHSTTIANSKPKSKGNEVHRLHALDLDHHRHPILALLGLTLPPLHRKERRSGRGTIGGIMGVERGIVMIGGGERRGIGLGRETETIGDSVIDV